jgi:hypothetical protein
VQRQPQTTASNAEIRVGAARRRYRLTQAIQTQLLKQDFQATPLVSVNVLEAPASKQ